MCGAVIYVYLLERTRVTLQTDGERSFHIFYQLIAGLSAEERMALQLAEGGDVAAYQLLSGSSRQRLEGVDDEAQLTRTMQAMSDVGMTRDEIKAAKRVLAALLLLGQLEVEESDDEEAAIQAVSLGALARCAAALSGVVLEVPEAGTMDAESLGHALCNRWVEAGGETVSVPLRAVQAREGRDALVKALYGKLFSWIVVRTNSGLISEEPVVSFIGVLGIFGFEEFKVNSFEQLCINFANEALQQQFNADVLLSEQLEYEREGIGWQRVVFADNQVSRGGWGDNPQLVH